MLCHNVWCNYAECRTLFTIMLNVIMLSVIMLSFLAPDTAPVFHNFKSTYCFYSLKQFRIQPGNVSVILSYFPA
jgi:hypothetical protein